MRNKKYQLSRLMAMREKCKKCKKSEKFEKFDNYCTCLQATNHPKCGEKLTWNKKHKMTWYFLMSNHQTLASIYDQTTFKWVYQSSHRVPGLCSKQLLRLSYYIHLAYDSVKTLKNLWESNTRPFGLKSSAVTIRLTMYYILLI